MNLADMNISVARDRARALAEVIGSLEDLDAEENLGRRRFKALVVARHQLFVDLWRDGFSIADVARILDVDHTSVMYGMRKCLGDDVYDRELGERYPSLPFLRQRMHQ